MLYKQTHRIHFDGNSFNYKLIILWFFTVKISTCPSRSGYVKMYIYLYIFGYKFLGIKFDNAFPASDIIRHVYLFDEQIK